MTRLPTEHTIERDTFSVEEDVDALFGFSEEEMKSQIKGSITEGVVDSPMSDLERFTKPFDEGFYLMFDPPSATLEEPDILRPEIDIFARDTAEKKLKEEAFTVEEMVSPETERGALYQEMQERADTSFNYDEAPSRVLHRGGESRVSFDPNRMEDGVKSAIDQGWIDQHTGNDILASDRAWRAMMEAADGNEAVVLAAMAANLSPEELKALVGPMADTVSTLVGAGRTGTSLATGATAAALTSKATAGMASAGPLGVAGSVLLTGVSFFVGMEVGAEAYDRVLRVAGEHWEDAKLLLLSEKLNPNWSTVGGHMVFAPMMLRSAGKFGRIRKYGTKAVKRADLAARAYLGGGFAAAHATFVESGLEGLLTGEDFRHISAGEIASSFLFGAAAKGGGKRPYKKSQIVDVLKKVREAGDTSTLSKQEKSWYGHAVNEVREVVDNRPGYAEAFLNKYVDVSEGGLRYNPEYRRKQELAGPEERPALGSSPPAELAKRERPDLPPQPERPGLPHPTRFTRQELEARRRERTGAGRKFAREIAEEAPPKPVEKEKAGRVVQVARVPGNMVPVGKFTIASLNSEKGVRKLIRDYPGVAQNIANGQDTRSDLHRMGLGKLPAVQGGAKLRSMNPRERRLFLNLFAPAREELLLEEATSGISAEREPAPLLETPHALPQEKAPAKASPQKTRYRKDRPQKAKPQDVQPQAGQGKGEVLTPNEPWEYGKDKPAKPKKPTPEQKSSALDSKTTDKPVALEVPSAAVDAMPTADVIAANNVVFGSSLVAKGLDIWLETPNGRQEASGADPGSPLAQSAKTEMFHRLLASRKKSAVDAMEQARHTEAMSGEVDESERLVREVVNFKYGIALYLKPTKGNMKKPLIATGEMEEQVMEAVGDGVTDEMTAGYLIFGEFPTSMGKPQQKALVSLVQRGVLGIFRKIGSPEDITIRPIKGDGPPPQEDKPTPKPAKEFQGEPIKYREGPVVDIVTPGGKTIKAMLAVSSADDLIPSHDATKRGPLGGFVRNPLGDKNERLYHILLLAGDSISVVEGIVENPNHAILLSSDPTPSTGPPITVPTGQSIGGNARLMAMVRIYHEGGEKAERLEAAVRKRAKELGIDVGDTKNPILHRMVFDGGEPGELSRLLNESVGAVKSQAAEAASRGDKVSDNTLAIISNMLVDSEGDGISIRDALRDPEKSSQIVASLVSDGAITDREVVGGVYWDTTKNKLNQDGKTLIENLLIGQFLKDPSVLAEMEPSAAAKLTASIGNIARSKKNKGSAGLIPLIERAVLARVEYEKAGGVQSQSIEDYFFAQSTFGEENPPGFGDLPVAALVHALGPGTGKSKGYGVRLFNFRMGQAVDEMVGGPGLFGDGKPVSQDLAIIQNFSDNLKGQMIEAEYKRIADREGVSLDRPPAPPTEEKIEFPVNKEEEPPKPKDAEEREIKALEEEMREILRGIGGEGGSKPHMGVDPAEVGKLIAAGTRWAVLMMKRGIRSFAAIASSLVKNLGRAVVPYVRSIYASASKFPGTKAEEVTHESVWGKYTDKMVEIIAETPEDAPLPKALMDARGLGEPPQRPQTQTKDIRSPQDAPRKPGKPRAGGRGGRKTKSGGRGRTSTKGVGDGKTDGNKSGNDADGNESLAIKRDRRREDARPDIRGTRGDDAAFVEGVEREAAEIMREGGKRAGIPDDVVENQIEDAASIVWAKENDSGVYILGNEAGSGKTFVLGSAAKTFLDQGENVLWVTKNHDLIRQAKDDLREFGVGGINFATYNEIRKKGYSPPDNPVLIFDESQSIKNLKSQSGKAGERLISNAKFTVMSSATPFDNPVDAEYLEATGVFDSVGGWKRWAIMYGASVREYKNREQEIVQVPYWPRDTNDQRVRDQQAANDWLKKQGIFIRRPKKLNPELVSAQFRKVTVAQKWVEMSRKLNIVYAKAAKELKNYDGSPASGIAHGLISAHWINLRKRMLEAAKVDALSRVAHEKMAAGEQFVVFVDTKALRSIGRFRKTGDTKGKLYTFPEMDSIMNGWIQKNRDRYGNINPFMKPPFHPAIFHIAKSMHEHGLDMELPSMLEDFENKIGKEHLAYYTGAQTEAEALRNKQEWLDGNKPGLIATMAKGGAGISLHPTTEGNPRSQLNTNLPWSPSMVEQVTGRLARYGVRSPVSIDWFFAENIPFERSLAVRVGGKMRDAGALVRGIDLPAAKALHDWDFEDGNTAMSLVMAEQEKMEAKSAQDEIDEMYRRAEALERNRKEGKSRGTDTTGDYFATPYPLSVLMQRLSGVEKGDRVLEPSAGTGNLLEFMPEGVNITAVEKFRHKGLEEQAKKHKSITTISSDFLDLYKDGKEAFDTIVMNPPFSRIAGRGYQDMTHIQKAETLLSPHGRMVAVLSEGAFFRADRQATEFRQWLEDVGAMVVKLPPDAFVASGTKVRARMIVVDGAASRRHGMTDSLNMGEDMKYQSVEDFIPPRQRYVGARPGFAINPMPEIRALIRYIRDQMRRLLRKMRWDRKWASLKKPPAYVMDADMPMSAENIEILVEAINKAKIPRHLQDMILHKRRQQIAARIHGIIENKTGVERAEAARKAMGGEMPKVGFDPLVDELPEGFPEMIADHVMSHQSFRHQPITKASVAETMRKILHDGYLPTLGELDLIEKFFGPRVAMSLFKKLGAAARFTDIFSKTWHSFTTILSSFDIGFARQAFTIFAAHPTTIPGAYQQLFRAVFSEKNAVEMQRQMKRELDIIDAGAVSGVELTMLPGTGPAHGGKMGGNIAETEETLHSSYVEYLKQLELHGPGVLLWPVKLFGMAIRASERAHVIPLNYLRLRLYRENAELLDAVGYTANTDAGARAHRDLAKVVNVSAGRATGKMLKHQLWGILMYAPRFAFSMIQGLFWTYPKNMVLGPKPLRIEAGRLMFSQIGALIALHWFIKAVAASFDMDIDVDLDPASSDFMRLRVGDNLYGPPKFAQDLRIVYLFFFGVEERVERKMFPNTPGSVRKYGRVPAWDVAKRFFKNKAHPGVQAITAVREGETFSKKGLTFSNFLAGLISPLAMEAIAEGYMRDGIKGGAAAFPEFFGINYYQREFDPEKDNNTYRYDKLADYLHRGNDRMAVMVFKNIVENGGKARRVRAALERRGIGDLREWEYMLHRME